jgi:para-nitrobenzyl esterase
MTALGDIVAVDGGLVSGLRRPRCRAFLGIPYARATRLAPPLPAEPWTRLEAQAFGPASPQPRRPTGDNVFGPPGAAAEQCLTVNVWSAAADADAGLPVFVYIHGGGFVVGRAGCAALDGARLASAIDAVVVTINYRLGSAGWCAHPELAEGPGAPAANWGLLDQIAALRWVRENIASFGGDPARVTLAGQSAGALCVIDLLAAPAAAGLFQRAVVQSPPIADAAAPGELTQRWALALSAEATGASEFDPQALRALSAEDLSLLHERTLAREEFRGTRGGALPTIDPASLPRGPREDPLATAEVDVLLGTTANEGTFFAHLAAPPGEWSEQELLARVAHLPGLDEARAIELVGAARALPAGARIGARALFAAIATDALVVAPAVAWGRARAGGGARVHRYRIDHRSPREELGATHSIDVGLMFASFNDDATTAALCGNGPAAVAASAALMTTIGAFLHGRELAWPELEPADGDDYVAVIGGEAAWRVTSEPQS